MASLNHLRAMEAFAAVGRLGSVKAAAVELGVSSGAVSQHIHRLEEALGVTLMERRGRGLELTQWGRLYHQEISAGFDQLTRAQAVLDRARQNTLLTVCGLPTLTAKWLGQAMWDWARDRSEYPVRLLSSEDPPDLNKGEADFSMWLDHPQDDQLGAVLFSDYLVPACAPSLLNDPVTTPADLFNLPLLHVVWSRRYDGLAPPSWARWADTHGLSTAPATHGALSFSLMSSAIDAAAAGQGVVLGQRAMMQSELASGRLAIPFDLRVPLGTPYSLRWSRTALEKPGAVLLRNWLLARGRREGA